jgi:hypothetical protein
MSKPANMELYNRIKNKIFKENPINSAFRSGLVVKQYKEQGGTYVGTKPKDGLIRWFKEEWKDIGGKDYPVFRPTKRISKDTPLLAKEIDKKNLQEQIKRKQRIKSKGTLEPFKSK